MEQKISSQNTVAAISHVFFMSILLSAKPPFTEECYSGPRTDVKDNPPGRLGELMKKKILFQGASRRQGTP